MENAVPNSTPDLSASPDFPARGWTTLRRRLVSEGTSFLGIKDELRRDAAIHHLCNSALSVADIGSLLGFQEPSAFHRAFKKWCGVQPGEYRLRKHPGKIRNTS